MEYYQNNRYKKFATNHSDSPDYVSYILVNKAFVGCTICFKYKLVFELAKYQFCWYFPLYKSSIDTIHYVNNLIPLSGSDG